MDLPAAILVQSERSTENYLQSGKQIFSYSLEQTYSFPHRVFARLSYLGGVTYPALLFTDFTQRIEINGRLDGCLGCSSARSNPLIPIANNTLPAFGYLTVELGSGRALNQLKTFTVIIELVTDGAAC